MNSKRFAKRMKDSGVSPVIATILMVAITVVLAAVLYVMVSGFTHSPGTTNSAGLTGSQSSAKYWNVTISSVSASNIRISDLKVVISGASVSPSSNGTYSFSSGLTGTIHGVGLNFTVLSGNDNTYLQTGDEIQLNLGTAATGTLTGATVTLYDGNSVLGSVSL